jgi:hypothetical protein
VQLAKDSSVQSHVMLNIEQFDIGQSYVTAKVQNRYVKFDSNKLYSWGDQQLMLSHNNIGSFIRMLSIKFSR